MSMEETGRRCVALTSMCRKRKLPYTSANFSSKMQFFEFEMV